MASFTIAKINSALNGIERDFEGPALDEEEIDRDFDESGYFGARIGLMNIKGFFLVRMLGIDGADADDQFSRIFLTIQSCKRRSTRANFQEVLGAMASAHSSRGTRLDLFCATEKGLWSLVREVGTEWLEQSRSCPPSLLKVDESVGIVHSILGNALDLLELVRKYGSEGEATDAFGVEVTFLKHFLLFAVGTGVEQMQLRNVLIYIRPFVINVACVFICDTSVFSFGTWISSVQSKCSTATALDRPALNAYAKALSTSALSSTRSKYGLVPHMDAHMFDTLRNFLESLISLFWDVLRVRLPQSKHAKVKVLYERLRFSRNTLKRRPDNFDQIGGVICDAAVMLISSLDKDHVGSMSNNGLSKLLQRFAAYQAKVNASTSQTLQSDSSKPEDSASINNCHGNEEVVKLQKGAASSSHQLLHNAPQIVGFQKDEVISIMNRLTRGSNHLHIVPIIGMAGLGKTTFAMELYNHVSVKHHFHSRAWCSISQVLDKRRVLLQLLNQTKPGSNTNNMSGEDIANSLRKSLKGKRYLIFLDDVWCSEVWNSLKEAFPDDFMASRVILTSRHHQIAPSSLIADGEPYLLRSREVDECLEILQGKLFPGKSWPLELKDLGMKFAGKCMGLPLTTVIVSGLLATTNQKDWKAILHSLSSSNLSGEEQCNTALELSFEHLPDDLKLCFLYFAVFPEDEEVSVQWLIRLWIAEGFVRKNELNRIEDVAREYLDKLIERSLVTVAKIRSKGGVKSCRLHDLLREFCLTKAKQQNFCNALMQSLDQLSDFNEPCNLQRLSIHSDPLHFQKSRLFCPGVHSLLFFSIGRTIFHSFHMSYIIQIYKHLQVLDMGQFVFQTEIPSEVGFLTRLTYLSIQSCSDVIPSSIGNLSNLETFIAVILSSRLISFPHTLWKLKKLKYLRIGSETGFTLPGESHEKSSSMLLQLETLSGVVFRTDGSMQRQMRKFPNIRRLSCHILPTEDLNKIDLAPDFLSHLDSLTITGKGKLRCDFGSTEHLRKLRLNGFELSREDIAVIGKFPNLEVLKLEGIYYSRGVLQMEEGEFSKLRYLKLHQHQCFRDLKKWIASDDQLPNLQKLVLDSCRFLKEIPSCLDTIPTLEEIEAIRCCPAVERLVRGIEEAHRDYGNSIKTFISRYLG